MKNPGFMVADRKFLTTYQGHMPYKKTGKQIYKILQNAILHAWSELNQEQGLVTDEFLDAEENQISDLLRKILNGMLVSESPAVDGFSQEYFDKVIYNEPFPNFNGEKPELRPDLVFRLKKKRDPGTHPDFDGIFTECKPVDESHPVVTDYLKKGVLRFVAGDYAWAMQDSMMIGYLRHKKKTADDFYIEFTDGVQDNTYNIKKTTVLQLETSGKLQHFQSIHGRNWDYATGKNPGEIAIHHIWLVSDSCD